MAEVEVGAVEALEARAGDDFVADVTSDVGVDLRALRPRRERVTGDSGVVRSTELASDQFGLSVVEGYEVSWGFDRVDVVLDVVLLTLIDGRQASGAVVEI